MRKDINLQGKQHFVAPCVVSVSAVATVEAVRAAAICDGRVWCGVVRRCVDTDGAPVVNLVAAASGVQGRALNL